MKVIVLCAGYGTRLYPLTKDQPKPLLPVAGRPILERLLEKIEPMPAVDQVFVVTNDRFHPHFRAWAQKKRYPWKLEVVNDGTRSNETRLGAIGDLGFVRQNFSLESDLGVLAGDNLFCGGLEPFFRFAESHRPHASLGVVDVKDRELATRYGIVRIGGQGKIIEFLEKPKDPPSTLASTGIYWFPEEGLDWLDRYLDGGHNADRIGDYVSWLVKETEVFAFPLEGEWFDIGDKASYLGADRLYQKIASKKGS